MVLPDATVYEYWQGRLVSVRFALGTADGRAAGTLARTIQVPSVSSIWIPVRRRVPAPGLSSGPALAGGHARVRRGGAGRGDPGRQSARGCGCPERPSFCSRITLSDG